nr:helix-turn-helix transcriptional regulator [Novosphingobium sp. FSW06-99]
MIGERIKARMAELGISQGYLAREVGVKQPTISALISGKSRSSTHLHLIARALQTTPAYLTGETDDPSIGAAALAYSPSDMEWLEVLHSLSPRDRNAVHVLMLTLAGRPLVLTIDDGSTHVPMLQSDRLEFKRA